jgi:acyl-coenzyme A thioesterase PaaI-like protein
VADARVRHHELCFGCGQANLFGLQLEVERREGGGVAGRFFVKQDHQGPQGYAHEGVIAAALDEAIALAAEAQGLPVRVGGLEVEFSGPAPLGSFVTVEAQLEGGETGELVATVTALGPAGPVAAGRAILQRW